MMRGLGVGVKERQKEGEGVCKRVGEIERQDQGETGKSKEKERTEVRRLMSLISKEFE